MLRCGNVSPLSPQVDQHVKQWLDERHFLSWTVDLFSGMFSVGKSVFEIAVDGHLGNLHGVCVCVFDHV